MTYGPTLRMKQKVDAEPVVMDGALRPMKPGPRASGSARAASRRAAGVAKVRMLSLKRSVHGRSSMSISFVRVWRIKNLRNAATSQHRAALSDHRAVPSPAGWRRRASRFRWTGAGVSWTFTEWTALSTPHQPGQGRLVVPALAGCLDAGGAVWPPAGTLTILSRILRPRATYLWFRLFRLWHKDSHG